MGNSKTKPEVSPEAREYIIATAKTTAEETAVKLYLENVSGQVNYYRAVESLLYNYVKLKKLVADEEKYTAVFMQDKSKSIVSYSANSGGTFKTKDDIYDEIARQKEHSYQRTKARFEEVERVINLFRERKEFIVIRMYYFGQDADGNQRPEDCDQYTFEDIAATLSERGILRDEKTARRWRSRIINDMAVCMFGKPAAISAGTYRQKTQ